MNVFERIEAQQKGKEGTPAFMVGEQLKDICRREPGNAALVEQDLEAVTLEDVAAKIKARADEIQKKEKGSCVCITPMVAEGIIREAYGLPGAEAREEPKSEAMPKDDFLDLTDFL